jgi:hypothetical protein
LAESNVAAWHGLLDDLDDQLMFAGRPVTPDAYGPGVRDIADIRRSHEPLGAMPQEVVERASQVLARYGVTVARLQDARRQVGDHLSILQSIRNERQAKPVYLDRVG